MVSHRHYFYKKRECSLIEFLTNLDGKTEKSIYLTRLYIGIVHLQEKLLIKFLEEFC